MTVIKMLYLQFYILLRAHIDSADAMLYCVELFLLMLVLLLYERAPALFESHFITFIVLSLFLSFLFTFHRCLFCSNSFFLMLILLIIRHCILTILYSQLSMSQTLLSQSRFY